MFEIRKAERSDVNSIYRLVLLLAEYEKMSDLVTGSEEDMEKLLFESGVGHCLVAEEEGEVVGIALYFYNLSTFKCRKGIYLEDLFVLPERRKEGIGTALLKEVLKRYSHVRQIELTTDDTPKTRAFYESVGFRTMASLGCCGFMKM